ncbi:MAG: MAPEG family protein [Alteromonadaceae bacterium]|nr:MAPEG family protein [Alteromonadaceae bacterium]
MLTHLVITGFYASLLTIILLGLTVNIIKLRFKYRVGLGDGEQVPLVKAIRTHGNFIEYIPLAIILLAVYELNGAEDLWLHLIGIILVLGRVFHAVGLRKTTGASLQRQTGVISTLLVLLVLAILNISAFIGTFISA